MTAPSSDSARYASTVLTLYLGLPETPLRPSAQDRRCAHELYDRNVPLRGRVSFPVGFSASLTPAS